MLSWDGMTLQVTIIRNRYFGCTTGKYAIELPLANSRWMARAELAVNNAPNHLHGGTKLGQVVWQAKPYQ